MGGLLLFRFHLLPLANRPIIIASIALNIRQRFSLQSPTDPARTLEPVPDLLRAAFVDGAHPPNDGNLQLDKPPLASRGRDLTHLWSSEGGGELKFKHLARLPKDNVLRPSTFPGTKAFIKLRHMVEVEIVYYLPRDGELGQRLKVTVAKGLELHNVNSAMEITTVRLLWKGADLPFHKQCGSYLPSLVLPEYSLRNPLPDGPSDEHPDCLCGLKLKP